jgi:hypothetical protein
MTDRVYVYWIDVRHKNDPSFDSSVKAIQDRCSAYATITQFASVGDFMSSMTNDQDKFTFPTQEVRIICDNKFYTCARRRDELRKVEDVTKDLLMPSSLPSLMTSSEDVIRSLRSKRMNHIPVLICTDSKQDDCVNIEYQYAVEMTRLYSNTFVTRHLSRVESFATMQPFERFQELTHAENQQTTHDQLQDFKF